MDITSRNNVSNTDYLDIIKNDREIELLLFALIFTFSIIIIICLTIATYVNYKEYINNKKNKPYKNIIFNTDRNYGFDDCCNICLNEFKSGYKISKLKCGHCFHKKCIKKWLSQNDTCPNCRCNVYNYDYEEFEFDYEFDLNVDRHSPLFYQESII